MDTATPVLYACVLFFCISYLSIVFYVADIHRLGRVTVVRELDCDRPLTMESETVRYQLHQRLSADTAETLKRTVFGLTIPALIGAAFLSYRYYSAGMPLWVACGALAVACFVLLVAASAAFGQQNEAKLAKGTQLTTYAGDFARITDLMDQLIATNLLFQEDRNAELMKGGTDASAVSPTSAPAFDVYLYQLEMRLKERIQNVQRMRSRAEASAYMRNADGATLVRYLRLYKDADYPLLTEILRAYNDDDQPAMGTDATEISSLKTNENSALLHILENDEDTNKDAKKLNYTAANLAALRAALTRVATTNYTPYIAEIDARLSSLTTTLYVLLFLVGYFAFKWAIYRTSQLIVTGAFGIFVAAYILYYSYLG